MNELKRCRVIEKGVDHKTKKLAAEVKVPASVEQVWQVLTDYENLPKFIPNLVECSILESKKKGIILLRQKACSQSLYWRLEAEAVLAVRERTLMWGAKELYFKLIEGDFEQFEGSWTVEGSSAMGPTTLRYEVNIATVASIPKSIVRHVIRAGLPANVLAVAKQAEKNANKQQSVPLLAENAMKETSAPIPDPSESNKRYSARDEQQEAQYYDYNQIGSNSKQKAKRLPWTQNVGSDARLVYMGVTQVTIPPFGSASVDKYKDEEQRKKQSVFRKQQAVKGRPKTTQQNNVVPYVNEIHLRRLDNEEQVHRRVIVELHMNATVQQVWDTLTDYEALPSFVPNLAQNKILGVRRTNQPRKYLRLRQVVYKCMPYLCFHAECHLDVCEIPLSEIQFKQVEGDFQLLQGKFIIQEIDPLPEDPANYRRQPPLSSLQYAIEMIVPRSNQQFVQIVPLLDKFAMEDLPMNLASIKQKIEYKQLQESLERQVQYYESIGETEKALAAKRYIGRPCKFELDMDMGVLMAELRRCYGHMNGYMPVQSEFLADGRVDLARAIQSFGGPHAVAKALNWKMKHPRRPRGYWMNVENLRKEMEQFVQENGLPPQQMPSRVLILKKRRKDLVRAIESHYGGFIEAAMVLGWELSMGSKQRVLPNKYLNQTLKQKLVLSTHEMDAAFAQQNKEVLQQVGHQTVEEEEKQVEEILNKYNKENTVSQSDDQMFLGDSQNEIFEYQKSGNSKQVNGYTEYDKGINSNNKKDIIAGYDIGE
eukprot:TRINITY_DN9309_c0_g1_i10.p1 TRINITY_DN9309_c0_g1~~TRINITY_DN9309_c0_g1_i10.p1  ORF type:complete len:831 (-),score=78.94 TRINITY_DN9309_c0_g1_i10:2398-4689(-)